MESTRRVLFGTCLSVGLLLTGCDARVQEAEPVQVSTGASTLMSAAVATASNPTLVVGGSCRRTDGWQGPDFSSALPPNSHGPVAISGAQLAMIAVKQPSHLPPGVGYCLAPSETYPNGYYTMNCKIDADCPSATFCEGIGQCRRQCSTDADCGSGMYCSGTPKAFCQGRPTLRQAGP
jgi:hypothetical protein